MLRTRLFTIGTFVLAATAVASGQQPPAENPLYAPPSANPFSDPIFAAPGTRTLPGGVEMPPPVAEAAFGPAVCLPKSRFWVGADFFYAAGRGTSVPPLLTTASPGSSGALFADGTRVAFGGRRELETLRPALRADAGLWFGEGQALGVDGGFVYLPEETRTIVREGRPGTIVFARPVYSVAAGTETPAASSAAFPTTIAARIATTAIGGDVNLRYNLRRSEFGRVDAVAGYRFLQLRDSVDVGSRQDTDLGRVTVLDSFSTRNDFHGPQVGLATSHRLFDRLSLDLRATVALGVTASEATVSGRTETPFGTANSGLLAAGSNSRRDTAYDFAVLPEGTAKLSYDVTDRFAVQVGYSILYWSDVRRAADQIDRAAFAADRPAFPDAHTDYWIQGVTLGATLRY